MPKQTAHLPAAALSDPRYTAGFMRVAMAIDKSVPPNPLSDGEIIVDIHGVILDVSPRTEQLLGRARAELINKGSGSLVTFEGFLTRTEDIVSSDAQHYMHLIEQKAKVDPITRDAVIKLAHKDSDAKVATLPLLVANNLTLALLFVLTERDDQTDSLTGAPRTVVVLGDWFMTLWKANTTAVVFLLASCIIILAQINIKELNRLLHRMPDLKQQPPALPAKPASTEPKRQYQVP